MLSEEESVKSKPFIHEKERKEREFGKNFWEFSRRIELDFEVVMCRLVLNAVKESRILSH